MEIVIGEHDNCAYYKIQNIILHQLTDLISKFFIRNISNKLFILLDF